MTNIGQTPFFKLLESLGEHVWQQDLVTKQIHVSAPFWESLGHDPGMLPLTQQSAHTFLHPVDLELAMEEVALHLVSDTPFAIEIRIRAGTGAWRFLRLRGCVVQKDHQGSPAFFAGTVSDITDAIHSARAKADALAKVGTLSNREREVLSCLVGGASNKNIAYALGLSTRTVEGYHARVLEKLEARGTSELVQVALAAGVTPYAKPG